MVKIRKISVETFLIKICGTVLTYGLLLAHQLEIFHEELGIDLKKGLKSLESNQQLLSAIENDFKVSPSMRESMLEY